MLEEENLDSDGEASVRERDYDEENLSRLLVG